MLKDTNKWDIFISHASEDKPFVDRLARKLKETGLTVWYDSFILELGDSLTQKINEGLAKSEYGIVILSKYFFNKDWTQLEVSALLNREIRNKKVILPIWHNITFEELRESAPLLVDKLAGNSRNESIEQITQNILKVVKPERFANLAENEILSLDYINDTELIILPLRPYKNFAVGISKYPTTNKQYRNFVRSNKIDIDKFLKVLSWDFDINKIEKIKHLINKSLKPVGQVFEGSRSFF